MSIKEARKAKGWTQEKVAELVGISRSAYTNIETGAKMPSVPVAQRIGKVLGIPWASILEDKPEPEVHDGQE